MKKYKVKEYEVLLDDEDYELVSELKLRPSVREGIRQVYFIYHAKVNGKRTLKKLHRLIMGEPKGMTVDHISGDTLDNRKANLRVCTMSENRCNSRAEKGSSDYKGVGWHKAEKKWHVRVQKDHKRYHIGYYDDEIEAARAYDTAAKKYHGEFARLNFMEAI